MNFQKALHFTKQKKVRLFLMAFLVSLLMWFIANLSKEYTKEIAVKIVFEEVNPGNLIQCKDSVLAVKIKGTGFTLWRNQLQEITCNIPVGKLKNNWTWQENQYAFSQLFPKNTTIVDVNPSTITFSQYSLAQKKVRLNYNITVTPKLGYGVTNQEKQFDSVIIYGHQKEIQPIKIIQTDSLFFNEVSDVVSGEVKIVKPSSVLKLSKQSIPFQYDVERFTQGEFTVPIQLKNKPENTEISIFPKQIQVQFQSPLSLFESYQPQQFLVTVDCSELEHKKNLPLVLQTAPEGMKNVRLLKKSVTFLILDK